MIDEKILHDRLADAAAAQDDLLPRSPIADLAAGRRRLRVRRVLTGASATVAVLAVGAVGLSLRSTTESQTAGRTNPVTTPTEAQRAELLLRAQTFRAHRPAGELEVARYLNLLVQSERTSSGKQEQEHVAGDLVAGAVKVELSTFGTARHGSCSELLSMPACVPAALPDGGRGQYAEGFSGTKYVRTARYEWPVGGEIMIRVTYSTKPSPNATPTRAIILALTADPLFHH